MFAFIPFLFLGLTALAAADSVDVVTETFTATKTVCPCDSSTWLPWTSISTAQSTLKPISSTTSAASSSTSSASLSVTVSSTTSSVVASSSTSTTSDITSTSSSSTISSTITTTSTTISSTATTSTTTTSCLVTSPTNYVVNGGFESGSLPPWELTNENYNLAFVQCRDNGDGAVDGVCTFLSLLLSPRSSATYTLTQRDIVIPAGTVVSCTASAIGNGSGSRQQVTLLIDDIVCGELTQNGNDGTAFTQFGSPAIVLSGNTHTVEIRATASLDNPDSGEAQSAALSVDNVVVAPVIPGACPISSISV